MTAMPDTARGADTLWTAEYFQPSNATWITNGYPSALSPTPSTFLRGFCGQYEALYEQCDPKERRRSLGIGELSILFTIHTGV
jgi:hypothetical protein